MKYLKSIIILFLVYCFISKDNFAQDICFLVRTGAWNISTNDTIQREIMKELGIKNKNDRTYFHDKRGNKEMKIDIAPRIIVYNTSEKTDTTQLCESWNACTPLTFYPVYQDNINYSIGFFLTFEKDHKYGYRNTPHFGSFVWVYMNFDEKYNLKSYSVASAAYN